MATISAAAGGGNWSANGTWVGSVPPTSADDVLLTVTSGNITVDLTTNACRSLNCTGYTGTLTFNGGRTLNVGDGTVGHVTFVAGMAITVNTGTLKFVSTTGVNNITTGGKSLPNVAFDGVSGSWQMQDNFTANGRTVTLTNGTLDMNGKTVSISIFSSDNSNTRTLTMGAAAITLTRASAVAWDCTTVTGLTVTANTATVTLSGGGGVFDGGGKNYNGMSLVISGTSATSTTAIILGSNTFANVTRTGTAANDLFVLEAGATQTITGTLTITGNSATNRVYVKSSVYAVGIATLNAAAVALTNCDFEDVTAAGAASPFSGTSISSLGGNTNITQTAPVTRYWVATAGGNWNDTSSWAAASGGASGASAPLVQDTTIFDGNSITSPSRTITMDRVRQGILDCTGLTNSPTMDFSGGGTIYGSVTLIVAMTVANWNVVPAGRNGGFTFTSAGHTLSTTIFSSAGSTYTLQDDLNLGAGFLGVDAGTLNTNGKTVSMTGLFNGDPNGNGIPTGMVLGASTITLTGTDGWNEFTGATVDAGTSTIIMNDATASPKNFAPVDGHIFYNLTFAGVGSGIFKIFCTATFNNVTISAALSMQVVHGKTLTINGTFTVNGAPGAMVRLASDSAGNTYTIAAAVAVVTYCRVRDCTMTGEAPPLFGGTNLNDGNNSGWVFEGFNPPTKGNARRIRIALDDTATARTKRINPTLAAGDIQVDVDGAGFVNPQFPPAVSPAGTCAVLIELSETNGDLVTVKAVDQTNPKEWADFFMCTPTTP